MIADLPTYDSLGFISPSTIPQPEEDDDFEEPIDEQARQEEEDARLARQLLEREQQEQARRVRPSLLYGCAIITSSFSVLNW